MSVRVEGSIVPPSIADERGKAFGEVMARAIADPDFKKLLFERIDGVDASVLPFLIREFSIEEFVEPGMTETVIRRLLKTSYELHADKGFLHGVRRGLLMLGMRVVWKQWFQRSPETQAGTHTATVYVNEAIFDGQQYPLDERVQRAAVRMIAGMKRYSQDVTFKLGVGTISDVAMASASRLTASVARSAEARPPLPRSEIGMAAAGRLTASMAHPAEARTPLPRSDIGMAAVCRLAQSVSLTFEVRP